MVMQYPQHIPLTDYESNVMVISSIVMNVTKNDIIPSIVITNIVN